ncbi:MAG: hypothetical protein WCV87_03965 [Candidatus Paceibacterota bacterium]|jgi:hypothetical protein
MKKFYFRIPNKIKEEGEIFLSATLIALLVFSGTYAYDVFAANPEQETLTVTIADAITFTVSTDVFGTLTPDNPKFATSTTNVLTNASAWHIELYGDDQATGNTVMDLNTDASIGITDDTQWVPSDVGTSTAGNATTVTSGDNVLAFRVMSASSSGATSFLAPTWWGTSDVNFNGSQLWAGIASTTASNNRIGSVSVYSANNVINTVQYYLDVPASQVAGAYSGGLTYTWVTGA